MLYATHRYNWHGFWGIVLGIGCWVGGMTSAHGQATAVRYVLSGVVLQMQDSTPVPYVHLYMGDRRDVAITDLQGQFSISYVLGDTLQVSSVGHQSRWIPLLQPMSAESPRDTLWLRTRVYQLQQIQVFSKSPMASFSGHRRINYDYRQSSDKFILRSRRPRFRAGVPVNTVGLSVVMEGVLSALLAPLTSEYKQLKKIRARKQEKHANQYYQQLKQEKLSDAFIVAHTHLRADELQGFLVFWNPSVVELEVASEYELIDILGKQERRYITYLKQINGHRSFVQPVTTLEIRRWLDETEDLGK